MLLSGLSSYMQMSTFVPFYCKKFLMNMAWRMISVSAWEASELNLSFRIMTAFARTISDLFRVFLSLYGPSR